jgi:hypothetical protein
LPGGVVLTMENCVVRNMEGAGLQLIFASTTTQTLSVSDTYFTDNGGDGIVIEPLSSGPITATIDRTAFYGNANGGLAVIGVNSTGALSVAVTDSVAANGGFGFFVQSTAGHSITNLSLTHSQAVGNETGVEVSGTNATLRLAQSTLTGNVVGFDADTGGVIKSYGDNYLAAANGAPIGSLTSVSKQ